MQIKIKQIFEYKCDWFQFFESILRNEIEDERFVKKYIKSYIVESNFKSIAQFREYNPNLEIIESKEAHFYNIRYEKEKFLYLDNENPRFWIIHSLENQINVYPKIIDIFCNSYLQDKIYIPNQMMEYYRKKNGKDSLGVSLKFKQLLRNNISKEENLKNIEEFIDNYSLRLWLRTPEKIDFFLKNFKKIGIPINYSFLNFAFYNDDNELIMKENFHRDGKFTIIRGSDFLKHVNFVEKVRDDYCSKIKLIEDYRIDWSNNKGELINILIKKEIDPKKLFNIIRLNQEIFRIIIFPLIREKDYYYFDCLDIHTGGRFSLQLFKRFMYINLKPDSCGNVVFRLVSNLQNYISPEISIEIDNQNINVLN
ncbi:MAG: hypothetical protein ACP6IY_05460 [Promethearchaeia archaeon]